MAIIPVERRFTSGISTLKWHTRWSKDEKGADDGDDETGDEAKNWASGFIVFKVKLFSDSSPSFSDVQRTRVSRTRVSRTIFSDVQSIIFRMVNKKLTLKFH